MMQLCQFERPSTGLRSALLAGVVTVLVALSASPAAAQSQVGSQTASSLLGGGSALVVAGSTEVLSGGGELVIASVETTAHGVRLVLRPVANAASQAGELAAYVTVEISQAAWEAAASAARAGGRGLEASAVAAGHLVEAVALHGSEVGSAAVGSALGVALVIGDVVVGIVAEEELAAMMGHRHHLCSAHSR